MKKQNRPVPFDSHARPLFQQTQTPFNDLPEDLYHPAAPKEIIGDAPLYNVEEKRKWCQEHML